MSTTLTLYAVGAYTPDLAAVLDPLSPAVYDSVRPGTPVMASLFHHDLSSTNGALLKAVGRSAHGPDIQPVTLSAATIDAVTDLVAAHLSDTVAAPLHTQLTRLRQANFTFFCAYG